MEPAQRLALLLVCLLAPLAQGRTQLTPQKFLEDNSDIFEIIYAASSRVGFLGGFLSGLLGQLELSPRLFHSLGR